MAFRSGALQPAVDGQSLVTICRETDIPKLFGPMSYYKKEITQGGVARW